MIIQLLRIHLLSRTFKTLINSQTSRIWTSDGRLSKGLPKMLSREDQLISRTWINSQTSNNLKLGFHIFRTWIQLTQRSRTSSPGRELSLSVARLLGLTARLRALVSSKILSKSKTFNNLGFPDLSIYMLFVRNRELKILKNVRIGGEFMRETQAAGKPFTVEKSTK